MGIVGSGSSAMVPRTDGQIMLGGGGLLFGPGLCVLGLRIPSLDFSSLL